MDQVYRWYHYEVASIARDDKNGIKFVAGIDGPE
jgi:hypothetical protein